MPCFTNTACISLPFCYPTFSQLKVVLIIIIMRTLWWVKKTSLYFYSFFQCNPLLSAGITTKKIIRNVWAVISMGILLVVSAKNLIAMLRAFHTNEQWETWTKYIWKGVKNKIHWSNIFVVCWKHPTLDKMSHTNVLLWCDYCSSTHDRKATLSFSKKVGLSFQWRITLLKSAFFNTAF